MMAVCKVLVCVFVLLVVGNNAQQRTQWEKEFWFESDERKLSEVLRAPNMNVAKNLVLAIGDGMDVTTTTATRIYRGQLTDGLLGEEALLSWDKFPYTGLSKTYTTDLMTADSAASATAYHCGVKTKFEMLGVDDTAQRKDCSTVAAAAVKSVLDYALESGKSVGIITTDALVGASPSAAYAHAAHRNWRADYELPDNAKGVCKDIARQLVEDNLDIQVLLGGGRKYFLPNQTSDPEYPALNGSRTDGKDLTEDWLNSQRAKGRKARYVTSQAEFDAATADNTEYLLGMFELGRVQEETKRVKENKEPSLAQMTEKAIQILSKNPEGFYLFIEGANIDMGHHESRARKALEEGLAFNDAVAKVMSMTKEEDTLTVVSADHSHAFSFAGYSRRGSSILGVANNGYAPAKDLDDSGNHYTILAYGNGPGYKDLDERVNLTLEENENYYNEDRIYASPFKLAYETHGGADVPIFASGPMSHIFTGVHEQTFIANGMAYAACIGRDRDHCLENASHASTLTSYSAATLALIVCGILM